jgi:multidrug efflux pump subunit AcrB
VQVEVGAFLRNADEVRNLMVGLHDGKPVYLRDVATVEDGAAEAVSYTRFGFGPGLSENPNSKFEDPREPGRGHDRGGEEEGQQCGQGGARGRGDAGRAARRGLPDDVEVAITRDYGETADEKVNELVTGLGEAIITVIVLIT